MKKKFTIAIAFILGVLPFLVGGIQNWYMLTYVDSAVDSALPYGSISLVVLLLWGCIAFLLNYNCRRTKEIVVSLNFIAALDLLLIGIQELILHAYWMNLVGKWSQLFYLPMINLGFNLTNWSHSVFPAYVACFILMVAVSFVGCKLKEKFQE